MVQVLRVELKFSILDKDFKKSWDSCNVGPYTGRYRVDHIGGYPFLKLQTSMEYQPEPQEDGMKNIPYGKVFGFKNIEQFVKWFYDDMAWLDWSGFVLAVYEVPESSIIYGRSQLAFSLKEAELIQYYDSCRRVYKDHYRRKRQIAA